MTGDESSLRNVLDKRSDVLRYLSETSARKPELVDELPISRSTVDRSIQDLLEVDCVTEIEGRYTATKTGLLALTEYDGLNNL
ncbi:hypothetical protein [Haloarcula laminariae]